MAQRASTCRVGFNGQAALLHVERWELNAGLVNTDSTVSSFDITRVTNFDITRVEQNLYSTS